MIVELPDTTTSKISKALVRIREEGGAVALGRVLTLVIATRLGREEEAIEAANDASREHPMRVIVLSTRRRRRRSDEPRLDAQIRVGGDAGASEVIVLRAYGETASNDEGLVTGLLLPDAPVVVWWPGDAPDSRLAAPRSGGSPSAGSRMPRRRPTRARASTTSAELPARRHRLRLDPPHAVARAARRRARPAAVRADHRRQVRGASDSPSTHAARRLAAAAARGADGVRAHRRERRVGRASTGSVHANARTGCVELDRNATNVATLTQPNQPIHDISLPRRNLRDCLAEELRRLDPDDLYGEVVQNGLGQLDGEPTGSGTEPADDHPTTSAGAPGPRRARRA